jgi:methylenetetrahydrofolate--tRNA-(uracil-5-)-methyltransferase
MNPPGSRVTIIGGGFAGAECAWQLARRGHRARLREMRPEISTAAHETSDLAEMVCSNSFRSDNPLNAVGLLKREMAELGSLVIACARETRVPAGDALAVDRRAFSAAVTRAIASRPEIEIVRGEAADLPEEGFVVVATGPLTSDALARSIRARLGDEALYFYDSMAPIVTADSLDFDRVYPASRYGKGGGDDYLNCPMTKDQYEEFVADLRSGETVPVHDFEKGIYFEGCLPIEVMAERGVETLRHGPLKPMGLEDPRTGRRPHAVVQLRQDDLAREHFNLVGFQTKLKVGEQKRIFRKIPGLEDANFARFGMLHRNTYIHAPAHLDRFFRLRADPRRAADLLRRADHGSRGLSGIGGDGPLRRRDARADSRRTGARSRAFRHGARLPFAPLLGTAEDEDVRADERDVRNDRGHVAAGGQGPRGAAPDPLRRGDGVDRKVRP